MPSLEPSYGKFGKGIQGYRRGYTTLRQATDNRLLLSQYCEEQLEHVLRILF